MENNKHEHNFVGQPVDESGVKYYVCIGKCHERLTQHKLNSILELENDISEFFKLLETHDVRLPIKILDTYNSILSKFRD